MNGGGAGRSSLGGWLLSLASHSVSVYFVPSPWGEPERHSDREGHPLSSVPVEEAESCHVHHQIRDNFMSK